MTLVAANYTSRLDVTESLDDDSIKTSRITHDAFGTKLSFKPSTTPAATKHAAFIQALTSGVATINLTALPGLLSSTIDCTGLKVRAVKIINPATNTHPLVIEPGGSNPYNLLGAGFKDTIQPGGERLILLPTGTTPVIGSGAKNIALSDGGAGGTESHKFQFVLG